METDKIRTYAVAFGFELIVMVLIEVYNEK